MTKIVESKILTELPYDDGHNEDVLQIMFDMAMAVSKKENGDELMRGGNLASAVIEAIQREIGIRHLGPEFAELLDKNGWPQTAERVRGAYQSWYDDVQQYVDQSNRIVAALANIERDVGDHPIN